MKTLKIKFLPLILIALIFSCSGEEEPEYAGLEKYTGKFRLTTVNGVDTKCYYNYRYDFVSENDLEIFSNGRFKRKMYSENSQGECVVSEILEGTITIKGTSYFNPFGILEYDNSERIDDIWFNMAEDGVHSEAIVNMTYPQRGGQYFYNRPE